MEKVIRWGLLIVIGGLVFLCIDQGCRKGRYKKDLSLYKAKYSNCINAPVKVDTLIDTVFLKGKTVIKPVAKIVNIYDTIFIKKKESWYDSTYRNDGLRFRWKAHTIGILEEIEFSDFVIPYRTIRERVTVDTCFDKKPVYTPKNHLGMDINLAGNRLDKMPNIDASVWWTIKDKWGVNIGGEYNTYHNELYMKAGVKLFFK